MEREKVKQGAFTIGGVVSLISLLATVAPWLMRMGATGDAPEAITINWGWMATAIAGVASGALSMAYGVLGTVPKKDIKTVLTTILADFKITWDEIYDGISSLIGLDIKPIIKMLQGGNTIIVGPNMPPQIIEQKIPVNARTVLQDENEPDARAMLRHIASQTDFPTELTMTLSNNRKLTFKIETLDDEK